MTPGEVDELLAGRRSLALATTGPDGRVHLVAMWYGFVDGRLAIETKAKSQKAFNLRRDPRFTGLVEAGDTYDELRGVELVGQATLVEDPDTLWRIGVSVFSRYFAPVAPETEPMVEQMLRKRVGFFLDADRTVSWDHRKLAAPGQPPP